jgi:hypothetical protein
MRFGKSAAQMGDIAGVKILFKLAYLQRRL